jgi:multidrug efflux pump subunit AcrA (membrane-fusion protein)
MRSGTKTWFRRRSILAVVALVVVGAGIGAGVTTLLTSKSSSAAPTITTTTSVQTVSTGTITKTVSSSGTIEPASTADLNFGSSGKVTAVKVSVGQTVTAGQALATIDDASLSASLAQAQATLASDQAQLSSDQSDSASSAQIASDNAQIASAETQVTSAQTSLNDATLTSTIAGTVAAVNLTVGQQVTGSSASSGASSSGSSASGSSSLGASSTGTSAASPSASSSSSSSSSTSSSSSAQIEVVSTGSYIVNGTVDATDVGQVNVGDQATLTGTGASANVYGTVASVGLLATTTSGVSSFPVVIDVTGSPSGLYGGASATISIVTQELQGVIVVPTTAIHYSGNNTTVTVDSDGSKVSRTVTIGAASGSDTQVTSGLAVGDKIYVTEITFKGGLGTGSRGSGSSLFSGGGTGAGGFPGGGGIPSGAGVPSGGGFGG